MSGVTPREPARSGYEQDVTSRYWRSVTSSKWLQTSYNKRNIRRRERQAGKREARDAAST